jgi:hypothetical protein
VSVLWIASVLFVAAAVVLIAAMMRGTAQATIDLRDEAKGFDELRTALVDLRAEADVTRETIDRIRARTRRSPVGR